MKTLLRIFALSIPLILSGCLFLPGKFDANLKLMQGGQYQFTYVGEMQIFSGDEKDMRPPKLEPFDPKNARCNDWIEKDGSKNPNSYYDRYASKVEVAETTVATPADSEDLPRRVKRACTEKELADLKQREIDNYERAKKDYEDRSNMMATVFGGAVPGNDKALKKFAARLSKYDGWDKVEYAGNNLFNVEYRASGNFDRYFAFPIINDAGTQFPFFQIVPRKSGELEVQVPAVGGTGGIMGLALIGGGTSRMSRDMPIKPIEGSFTIETDGEVLGNNSPDGYKSEGGLKVMQWNIESLSESPRALIKVK